MQLCFWDKNPPGHLAPLTLTRPTDDLRIGLLTLREKWMLGLQSKKFLRRVSSHLRPLFGNALTELKDYNDILFINPSVVPNADLLNKVSKLKKGQCIRSGEQHVATRLNMSTNDSFKNGDFDNVQPFESADKTIELNHEKILQAPWDIIRFNEGAITEDLSRLGLTPSPNPSALYPKSEFIGNKGFYIGKSVQIEPGCTLIAKDGPVVIQSNAHIEANSVLRGPIAICHNATVKTGAHVYEGSVAGPHCKIAGEISNTIFHSYSNKAHHGYVGDSVFGQWVNLGAGTTTSNLKNNYASVSSYRWQDQEKIETGLQFLGTIMGDHSKTAINTSLNTGTICGVSSNIFRQNGFPPTYIPSFTWLSDGEATDYRIDKALETMDTMMRRRNQSVTKEYEAMMRHIFEQERESS